MTERGAFPFSGVGFATRQVGNRTKPNLVVCVDDQGLICMKSQSTFKTTEIKFKLNESFEETTADDRKTTVCNGVVGIFSVVWSYLWYEVNWLVSLYLQTVVTLENGKLVQKQCWDGKESTIEREVTDGKLIAVRILFHLL